MWSDTDSLSALAPYQLMRQPSKPSTAQCNCSLYTLFLMAEPKYVSCVRLAEILATVSHDSVNRFLLRERYTPEGEQSEIVGVLTIAQP